MKNMSRVSYLDHLFTRSCLESSVAFVRLPKRFISAVSKSRDRTHTELHQLKRHLLRAALDATPQTHLFKHLCGAANQAAELAWNTTCPLLLFPCLFEELATVARENATAPEPVASRSNTAAAFELPHPVMAMSAA